MGEVGRACMSFLLTCGVPSPEPPSWAGTANMGRNSDCQLEAGLLPSHSGRGPLLCHVEGGPRDSGWVSICLGRVSLWLLLGKRDGQDGSSASLSLAEALGSNHSSTAG